MTASKRTLSADEFKKQFAEQVSALRQRTDNILKALNEEKQQLPKNKLAELEATFTAIKGDAEKFLNEIKSASDVTAANGIFQQSLWPSLESLDARFKTTLANEQARLATAKKRDEVILQEIIGNAIKPSKPEVKEDRRSSIEVKATLQEKLQTDKAAIDSQLATLQGRVQSLIKGMSNPQVPKPKKSETTFLQIALAANNELAVFQRKYATITAEELVQPSYLESLKRELATITEKFNTPINAERTRLSAKKESPVEEANVLEILDAVQTATFASQARRATVSIQAPKPAVAAPPKKEEHLTEHDKIKAEVVAKYKTEPDFNAAINRDLRVMEARLSALNADLSNYTKKDRITVTVKSEIDKVIQEYNQLVKKSNPEAKIDGAEKANLVSGLANLTAKLETTISSHLKSGKSGFFGGVDKKLAGILKNAEPNSERTMAATSYIEEKQGTVQLRNTTPTLPSEIKSSVAPVAKKS